jgi:hypothetical protein
MKLKVFTIGVGPLVEQKISRFWKSSIELVLLGIPVDRDRSFRRIVIEDSDLS